MGSKCIVEFLGRPGPPPVVGDPRNTIPMFHDINSILESVENTINNMDLMKTKKPRKITEEIDPSKHRLPKCHGKIRKIPVELPMKCTFHGRVPCLTLAAVVGHLFDLSQDLNSGLSSNYPSTNWW